MNVEECLRQIEEKSALVRYFASGGTPIEPPDATVLAGLAGLCAEIERLAGQARGALDADALGSEVAALESPCR